jgi:HNH endonuclease
VAGKSRVPRSLRERVAIMAGHRCGYCRTPESIAGFRLSIEHIIPEAKGGKTVEGNLWPAMHAMSSRARVSMYEIPSLGNVSDCGTRDVKSGQITFHGVMTGRRSWV